MRADYFASLRGSLTRYRLVTHTQNSGLGALQWYLVRKPTTSSTPLSPEFHEWRSQLLAFQALREQAFEAAERSYQQTARDLGYSEAAANGWISAVMFRLRGKVTELIENRLNPAASSPEQKIL
jgi:hypothetical protein